MKFMKNHLQNKSILRSAVLFMVLSILGISNAFADDYDFSAVAPSGQTLYYKITDFSSREVTLTYPCYYSHQFNVNYIDHYYWFGYSKPVGDIVIPAKVEFNGDSYSVTSIREHAFGDHRNNTSPSQYNNYYEFYDGGCEGITSIVIPSTVSNIGADAFAKCNGLTSITIPGSVTSIGTYAFNGCNSLISITIPGSVTSISSYAFSDCTGLTSITIPSSVTSIGTYAFSGCNSLTSITIPSSVTSIGTYAFNCNGLTEITSLNSEPPTINNTHVFNNVSKTIPVYIPIGSSSAYQNAFGWKEFSNFIEVPSRFFSNCSSGQTLYFAVTDLANNYVEIIYPNTSSAPWEGYDQPTGNVVIPETVEYQGITYVVKGIQKQAFYGCTGMTKVTISENIDYVFEKAFWNCPNLETVNFNAEECAIMQTRTGSGTNSDPYNYYSVFSSNETGNAPNITRIVIGNSVQHIPDYAFKNAEDVYQRLVIPASVTDIGNYAFYGCNSMVQMVIQGNGLLTIGNYAFYGCSALQTALNLPNSVVSTGIYSFYGCSHIPSLSIGEGMSQIGAYTFWNCPAIIMVNFNAVNCIAMKTRRGAGTNTNPYVDYSVFNSGTGTGGATPITTLNIGANVTNIPDFAFRNSPNVTNNLVLPEGLLNIGQYAFHNGGFTGNLTIPNTTQTIGQYAFYGCGDLTALTIGEGVESIGGYAYWNCPQIQTVNFNAVNCTTMNTDGAYSVFNSGTSIGGETPINNITIGNNVTNIPDYAFYNSPNATNTLPLPDGLLNIGAYAFYNCSGMTGALSIPNTVASIGQYGFYHCSGFDESLTLSNALTTINAYTFSGCNGFTGTLTIPSSVLTIAEHAFEDCSSFTGSLAIHDALTSIGESAFYGCSNIAELTLGEGVETIGGSAFWNCPELHTVHFNSVNCTSMNTSSQYSVFNVGTTSGGATPIVTLSIGENVTRIPDYAFRNSVSATSKIVIPNATTYIGTYSFFGFRSNELTIGEGVVEIGGYAFWYCPSLQTVHFNAINCTNMKTQTGSGNNIVYYSVFNGGINTTSSPSLVLLTIGKKVQTIPDYAFKNCSSANCKLLFPNTLMSVGVQAFYEGNSFIGDLVLPNPVTSLGEYAFYNCHSFDGSLIIGSGIQTINQYTFADCDGFTGALIIGRSVESIGDYSFRNCSGFSTVISEHPTPPTALNTSFNNMTYSISIHVPYAMVPAYQAATGWSSFTNYREQFVFDQLDNDLWSDTQNWYSFALPTANDVVCVNSNCQMDMDAEVLHLYVLNLNDVMTINNGETLSVTYGIGTLQPSQLVIADGGQLVNPVSNAFGTVQRNISGYGSGTEGWFTVATPIYEGTETDVLTTGTYDLFYYDEPTHHWMNKKVAENNFASLEPAQGYLYANQAQKTLSFAGQINASNADFSLPVTCNGNALSGFTLVGNPYTNNISISSLRINGTAPTLYYKAIGGGNFVAYTDADNEPIKPGEGFMVQAAAEGVLTFNNDTHAESGNGYVRLVLKKDNEMIDRAYLRMGDGETLKKLQSTHAVDALYFKQDGENRAVAAFDGAMMLCFESVEAGIYTLEASLLNVGCRYLHLIDRQTGNDIDLLSASGYTFVAGVQDEADRFELVLNPQSRVDENERGNRDEYFVMPTHTQTDNQDAFSGTVNYTITASANPSEGGTVSGGGSYAQGANCTLTATANTGYSFVNWTEGGTQVSTEANYSFAVNGNRTLVANFVVNQPNNYIITATANPAAGGTVSGGGSYAQGANCTLTATPNTGYAFVNWTKNSVVVSTNASYSFTVSEAATYVANFELQGQITNHWTPIGGTQYNMTINGVIYINNVEQTVTTLEVGAFCGEECRGSMLPEFFPPSSQYVVSLTVVSNQQNGETITFKLYDHSSGQELNLQCVNDITFASNEIVGTMGNWFQFAFNSEVSVSATVDPVGAGNVTGTGNYVPGTTATLTATANEGYVFNNWSIGGATVSTDNPYTFTVTGATALVAQFNCQQQTNLSMGWNWWSTYIEQDGIDGLTMLEESLGHNGLMIKTQIPYVQNYYPQTGYDYWFGSLTNVGLNNETGYQISVSANCDAVMTGAVANPADHSITLQTGWNWIGYPVNTQQSLSSALSGFTPTANDLIKGQSTSSTYYAGYGWFPTSFTLTPGQGYMYYSNAAENQTLTYNVGRGEDAQESPQHVWTNDIHAHASNIVIMAIVTIDGEEQQSDNLELGAFVNGECRGSAVLQYFEPTNRWYAMLTVSGEEGESLTFAAIDRCNGTIKANSSERLTYYDNAIVGNLDKPYEVHFGSSEVLTIYPNPVEHNTAFSLDIPSDETIAEVLIINALGEAVKHETGSADRQMPGINGSGIYLVKIVCCSGNVYVGRLIVR